MLINISEFFKKQNISFKSEKQALNWVRKLQPNTLGRVGTSYFIEDSELETLFQNYVMRQRNIKRKLKPQRQKQAKSNFDKKNPNVIDQRTQNATETKKPS